MQLWNGEESIRDQLTVHAETRIRESGHCCQTQDPENPRARREDIPRDAILAGHSHSQGAHFRPPLSNTPSSAVIRPSRTVNRLMMGTAKSFPAAPILTRYLTATRSPCTTYS